MLIICSLNVIKVRHIMMLCVKLTHLGTGTSIPVSLLCLEALLQSCFLCRECSIICCSFVEVRLQNREKTLSDVKKIKQIAFVYTTLYKTKWQYFRISLLDFILMATFML
jgi:hypothetical protein